MLLNFVLGHKIVWIWLKSSAAHFLSVIVLVFTILGLNSNRRAVAGYPPVAREVTQQIVSETGKDYEQDEHMRSIDEKITSMNDERKIFRSENLDKHAKIESEQDVQENQISTILQRLDHDEGLMMGALGVMTILNGFGLINALPFKKKEKADDQLLRDIRDCMLQLNEDKTKQRDQK